MNKNKTSETDNYTWEATAESKGKAKSLRLFAILAWAVAIGLEIWAIIMLRTPPISMAWLIGLIVVDLGLVILGSVLWKKSNRLDPASEKDKARFFIQNQLGVIISIIAFLPLVVLIFTNKDLNGKQKGILGSVAIVAMLIASIVGIDFNPASIEQYTEQTKEVEVLMGTNKVFWTESGKSYHLFEDCSYINSDRTKEVFNGTVAKARELKNITDICDRCKNRVAKEKTLQLQEKSLETK
jgi:dipeptide/tripeptide permease